MDSQKPAQNSNTTVRSDRLRAVLRQVVTRRAGGEAVPDDQVIRAHPDLMPELMHELHRLKATGHTAAGRPIRKPPTHRPETAATSIPMTDARTMTSHGVAPAPPMISAPGFRVLREISRGGQAVVFEAVQESTGRRVALKVT